MANHSQTTPLVWNGDEWSEFSPPISKLTWSFQQPTGWNQTTKTRKQSMESSRLSIKRISEIHQTFEVWLMLLFVTNSKERKKDKNRCFKIVMFSVQTWFSSGLQKWPVVFLVGRKSFFSQMTVLIVEFVIKFMKRIQRWMKIVWLNVRFFV